jgi:dTDP-L-rhamnose 4-epimerase
MKILVTGGAGFIGSHTVDALLKKGHEVRILDNLQKPVHLKGKPNYIPQSVEFLFGDVREKNTLEYALEGMDAVYHFAAYQDYLTDFSTFFHVNCVSTALIYEIIVEKKLPIKKVIVASSQSVLGEGFYICENCKRKNNSIGRVLLTNKMNGWESLPNIRDEAQLQKGNWEHRCKNCDTILQYQSTPEELINPQNQYALSKHSEESIAINLGKRYSIPTVALRYSIVQGPRQSFYNAYSGANRIFCLNLFLGKAPTIYEDGKQIRDYVSIQDVVQANILVLENEKANYQIYHVGGGKPYSVLEFYGIVSKIFIKDISPNMPGLYRLGDTRHIFSDIRKLSSLGWKPLHTPEDSVKDYKRYLEEQTDIEDILDYSEKKMKVMGVVKSIKGSL